MYAGVPFKGFDVLSHPYILPYAIYAPSAQASCHHEQPTCTPIARSTTRVILAK